jgi:hypothetical protein
VLTGPKNENFLLLTTYYMSAFLITGMRRVQRDIFDFGESEGEGSAGSLPGFGVSPKNSFSFFLPAAGGKLENEIALT